MSARVRIAAGVALFLIGALGRIDSKPPRIATSLLPAGTFQEHLLSRPEAMDHFEEMRSEFFSPNAAVTRDGKYLIIGTCQPMWTGIDDYEFYFYLIVYDIGQKRYTHVLSVQQDFVHLNDSFADIQISSDDRLIAVTWSNAVSVYSFDNTKGRLEHKWTKRVFHGETKPWNMKAWCTFSEDEKQLLVTCPQQPLTKFDALTGERLERWRRHSKVVPGEVTDPIRPSGAIRSCPIQVALLLDNWGQEKGEKSIQGIAVQDFNSKKAKFLNLEEPVSFYDTRLVFQPGKNVLVTAYVTPHPKITGRALQLVRWEWETDSVHKDLLGTYWELCSDLLFSPDGAYALVLVMPNWITDPGLLVIETGEWKVIKGYRLPSSRGYKGMFAAQAKQLVLLSSDAHLLIIDWPKFVEHLNK
jgi:hypothetical protein